MTHNTINYLDIFRQHGCRLTRQREAILDAICRAGGHATFAEIAHLARQQAKGIDRSTLYRSLDTFVRLGLVICAEDRTGERLYEIVQVERHHHLFCKVCGGEVGLDSALVDGFFRDLHAAYGFEAEMDHLIVSGVCAGCSGKRTTRYTVRNTQSQLRD